MSDEELILLHLQILFPVQSLFTHDLLFNLTEHAAAFTDEFLTEVLHERHQAGLLLRAQRSSRLGKIEFVENKILELRSHQLDENPLELLPLGRRALLDESEVFGIELIGHRAQHLVGIQRPPVDLTNEAVHDNGLAGGDPHIEEGLRPEFISGEKISFFRKTKSRDDQGLVSLDWIQRDLVDSGIIGKIGNGESIGGPFLLRHTRPPTATGKND